MKRIYAIFFATAMLVPLVACKNEMPEKFEAMPNTLSEEKLTIPENEPAYKCIESHYHNDELEEKYEILYDEHDHTIKKNKLDINTGEVIHSSLNTEYGLVYDENGNLVKDIWYGNDKNDIGLVIINTYDEAGKQTSTTIQYNNNGELKNSSYYETKYDEHGNETEWFTADVDEGIEKVCKYTYEYDENGNITKKTVNDSAHKGEIAEHTYTYDDAGNMLTETRERTKDKFGNKKETFKNYTHVYEYDDHSNLIKKTSDVYGSEQHTEQHTVINYEYDDKNRKILEINGSSEIRYEYEDY